jgi:hypothetical protein
MCPANSAPRDGRPNRPRQPGSRVAPTFMVLGRAQEFGPGRGTIRPAPSRPIGDQTARWVRLKRMPPTEVGDILSLADYSLMLMPLVVSVTTMLVY